MARSNSPLCILHILDHSLPLHSGYSFRSQEILRVQRDRGWRPVVLTTPKHEESWRGARSDIEIIEGFQYYRTGPVPGGENSIRALVGLLARTTARLREVVAREAPDIIHAHSPVLNAIPALRIGKEMGIPVVYEIRAFWEDAAVDHGAYRQNSWKYQLVRFMETWVCGRAHEVIVICGGLRDDLIARGIAAERITVVRNGINTKEFQPAEADTRYLSEWKLDGKRVIGFVGSFYHYEGLDVLVDAFARLASVRPDVVLLLVGGGPMESRLKAQIADRGLSDRVIVPGRIPHERMRGVYSVIDVLAYPRYATRLTESVTPLKPLEAMATGKALVASDVGGHRELIRHRETGVLVPPGDARALAGTIGSLLEDRALCQAIQRRGVAIAREQWTWDMVTGPHAAVYARALRRPVVAGDGMPRESE
jgi:PEP-CTERM/exosortase A-associated glycosyltransferase